MQPLDIRWLRANRHLRAAPFLAAAQQLLGSQVKLTLDRCSEAYVPSSAASAEAAKSLRHSAQPFLAALQGSKDCDALIRAHRLLGRWIQQIPSQTTSPANQVGNGGVGSATAPSRLQLYCARPCDLD
jgi:hypothetical protein